MKSVVLLSFLVQISYASTQIILRSLSDVSTQKIKLRSDKPSLFVVFQKDCSACRRQIKNLKCIDDSVNVVLVGSFSNEKDLRVEYSKFGSRFVGVYGDRSFRKKFRIREDVTPQLIFATAKRQDVHLGFLSCESVLKKIKEF